MSRTVNCIKLGIQAEGLDFPPVPSELGLKILENVSAQAWQDWLQHQTILINEYRLNLRDSEAREFLMKELENYFFGDASKKSAEHKI